MFQNIMTLAQACRDKVGTMAPDATSFDADHKKAQWIMAL
jgi:hypothetical protein